MTAEAPLRLFSEQQWRQLHPLLKELDERQRLWVRDYLTASTQSTNSDLAARAYCTVTIAYGTETDNCKYLSSKLDARCRAAGIATELIDLAQIRVRKLGKLTHMIVIIATHGDGDPPEPATDFYQALMSQEAPQLNNLRFAVLALGDSSYEHFCVTGQSIDRRLESLGAKRLIPRRDCDVDFEEPAAEWVEQLLPTLPRETNLSRITAGTQLPPRPIEYTKSHLLEVEVLTNRRLSHSSRSQSVHHLELALPVPDFPLEPGDAVGVLPENPPELVAKILDATGLSGEQPVTFKGGAVPLVEALRKHLDLTIPSSGFIASWARLSRDDKLVNILGSDSRTQRTFLREHQICDLIQLAPARPHPQTLVDSLRPQQPRLYDLANSLTVVDDELHLTVKAFRYPFWDREEKGIASHFLLDLQPGDTLQIYPHRNVRFRLPENPETPLILVAEATGIAPYRAFVQELTMRGGTPPPCWLVFAEQNFEEDFLYQVDLQKAVDDGILTYLDTIFYADEPHRTLTDLLLERSDLLSNWLDSGGHLYLCGEKNPLTDCETRLEAFLDKERNDGYWNQISKAKRVHRNLY